MLQVMAKTNDEEVREGTNEYSLYFVIAGISVGFATFLQVSQQQVIIIKSAASE
jgi:ATP-binding cassette subfamily B (MDR/TAP) protein 1